jgi:hypothetical protein
VTLAAGASDSDLERGDMTADLEEPEFIEDTVDVGRAFT